MGGQERKHTKMPKIKLHKSEIHTRVKYIKMLTHVKHAKQSLEEIFNNFYYKILYSYPFIGDYYINTML